MTDQQGSQDVELSSKSTTYAFATIAGIIASILFVALAFLASEGNLTYLVVATASLLLTIVFRKLYRSARADDRWFAYIRSRSSQLAAEAAKPTKD